MSGTHELIAYHERSKHHVHRFAPSPGYLDWATQPDPFRRFAGSPRTTLPLATGPDSTWDEILRPGAVARSPLDLASLAAFLELALGLSAWKQLGGARWALRSNPSSGNLHPTEAYVLLPPAADLPAGLHHYLSEAHALEQRAQPNATAARALHDLLPAGGFLLGMSSIHWREAWKYGERAYRYCQHDVGHALGALRYAAASLGWSARLVMGASDEAIAALLGLDRVADYADVPAVESEHPDALVLVAPADADLDAAAARLAGALPGIRAVLGSASWSGRANRLSPDHVHWQAIDAASRAALDPGAALGEEARRPADPRPALNARSGEPAASLIRRRRSAVDMDGATSITASALYEMLDALLPRQGVPPLDILPWRPLVHLLLFVHRVRDLEPGLYLLARDAAAVEPLRAAMKPAFAWERPRGCPRHLDLFLLLPADVRDAARLVSCQQDIAADGAFSLGMLASFRDSLEQGACWYRRLFWESGIVGQALYLEAEAASVRGTGIGCYFDDAVHEIAGLADDRFQDLYHFTIGGAVDDPRLLTLPPYPDRRSG